MFSSESLSKYFEVHFTLTHVGALLNDHGALDFDVALSFLLEANAFIDAVRPLKTETWNTALSTGSVLEESFVGTVLVHICNNIVKHNNNQIEIIGKAFKLLDML